MGHDFKDHLASDIQGIHRKCQRLYFYCWLWPKSSFIAHLIWLPSLFLTVYASVFSCVALHIDVRGFKVSLLFPLWLVKGLSAALYCHQTQAKEQLGSELEPGTQVAMSISFFCISNHPCSSCLLSISFVSQPFICVCVCLFSFVFTFKGIVQPKLEKKILVIISPSNFVPSTNHKLMFALFFFSLKVNSDQGLWRSKMTKSTIKVLLNITKTNFMLLFDGPWSLFTFINCKRSHKNILLMSFLFIFLTTWGRAVWLIQIKWKSWYFLHASSLWFSVSQTGLVHSKCCSTQTQFGLLKFAYNIHSGTQHSPYIFPNL